MASRSPTLGKNPWVPMIELPSPKASPKPTAQYTSEHSANVRMFLPATCAAFFMRVMPASRNAKPACMNMTSTAATTTQIVLPAITRSALLIVPPSFNDKKAPEALSSIRSYIAPIIGPTRRGVALSPQYYTRSGGPHQLDRILYTADSDGSVAAPSVRPK